MSRHVSAGRRRGWLAAALLLAAVTLAGCATAGADEDSAGDSGGPPASVSGPATKYHGIEFGEPQSRPSFTLTDTSGLPFDFAARTAEKPTLLYFGYTHCPDICPTTMATLATAIRSLPADVAADLQVVFVTTDPARDTGDVLKTYLSKFDADLATPFVGLTGALPDVEAAQAAAGVPVAEDAGQTHSTLVMFYGRDDVARIAFPAGFTSDDVVHDLPLAAGP